MDISITYDRFFYQLAQENYEICYSILAEAFNLPVMEEKILRSVIYIDMLYYNYTQASSDDDCCMLAMKEVEADLASHLENIHNPIFSELSCIIRVKVTLFSIYKELIGADYNISLDLNRRFESLLKELSPLQNYELLPYKENLVFQITSLQNLILSFKSLSTFNYMGTILSLTQAHSNIQQWEKVFIHKKFSPMDPNNSQNLKNSKDLKNSKEDSNELHKYLLNLLHCLIAKATLYFHSNLSNIHHMELLEFGDDYITSRRVCIRCAELKIHYLGLYLHTNDSKTYQNFMEGGYKCLRQKINYPKPQEAFIPVYEYRWKSEELPSATKEALVKTLGMELSLLDTRVHGLQENTLDVFFNFAKVDTSVYLAAAFAYSVQRSKSEKLEIAEFINKLAGQLRIFG